MSHVTTPALAFAAVKPTSTRPLPNPNLATSGNGKDNANTSPSSSFPIAAPGDYHHRIPLPSFATMSRSLPSGSVLNEYPVEKDDVHLDAYEYPKGEDVDDWGKITSLVKAFKPNLMEKKTLKHLWHAALVLLLERGRSVTRACYLIFLIFLILWIYPKVNLTPLIKNCYLGRVVVTSSPLYQPMDGLERLGYELRVYVRVPDLGMPIHLFQELEYLLIIQVMAWTDEVHLPAEVARVFNQPPLTQSHTLNYLQRRARDRF
jgi:hypothetical protein